MVDKSFVIDKDYIFGAFNGSSILDEIHLHVQCNHEQAMYYGRFFSNSEIENNECIDFKDKLDETLAESIAKSMFRAYDPDSGEEDEEPKTLEDFYEDAYQYIAENYYYYCWSDEFKKDCINYYNNQTMKTINIKSELRDWLINYLTNTIHGMAQSDNAKFNEWAKSFKSTEAAVLVNMEFLNDWGLDEREEVNEEEAIKYAQTLLKEILNSWYIS